MRLIRLASLLLLAGVPLSGSAQEVSDAPAVILKNVPFEITVDGAAELSSWYEIRTATGRVLGGGTVGPAGSASARDLLVASGDELPLLPRGGIPCYLRSLRSFWRSSSARWSRRSLQGFG
jgi:hypothetical protein